MEEFKNSQLLKNMTVMQAEKIARLLSYNWRNGIDKLYLHKPKVSK